MTAALAVEGLPLPLLMTALRPTPPLALTEGSMAAAASAAGYGLMTATVVAAETAENWSCNRAQEGGLILGKRTQVRRRRRRQDMPQKTVFDEAGVLSAADKQIAQAVPAKDLAEVAQYLEGLLRCTSTGRCHRQSLRRTMEQRKAGCTLHLGRQGAAT